MKKVYIAGPYTSKKGVEGEDENVAIAAEVAYRYLVEGWAPFCPHTMTRDIDRQYNTEGFLTWEDWLMTDLAWLACCDAIHMLPNWRQSKGATLEYMVAKALGLEILGSDLDDADNIN